MPELVPFDASSPAEPAVVALFDQLSGELGALVVRARADLAAGWNPVRLVDVLAAEMFEVGRDEPVGQASLFAAAVVQLAALPDTTQEA